MGEKMGAARNSVGLIILLAFMTLGTNGTESCVTMPPPSGQGGPVYGNQPPDPYQGSYGAGGSSGGGGSVGSSSAGVSPPQTTATFYRLRNRWKSDQAIHIENGYVQSGSVQPGWWSAMWSLEPVSGVPGHVRIHNRWKTDQYLHIENGQIQSGPIQGGWWSAMWSLEPVSGVPGYYRIHNRWKTDQYLHIENGQIQSGPIQGGWWSAMWTTESVGW